VIIPPKKAVNLRCCQISRMTANMRMPLVNSDKNAQIGKVFAEVDTTSQIYQLFESNFNASDRKLPNFKLGSGGSKQKVLPSKLL